MAQTEQTLPAFNPADLESTEGLLNFLKKQVMQDLYVSIPAVVISFDRGANRAKIQPAIYTKAQNGQTVPWPSVANVPVHTPGGGGFAASFPLNPGDTGFLMVCDRDISLFKQSLNLTTPNTYRTHQLEDGFFLPDVFQTINVAETDSAVWQTLDGSVKCVLSTSGLTVTAETENNGNVTINGDLAVNGNVTVEGNITATGNIGAGGMMSAAGNISSSGGDISAGSISLKKHVHGGVQGGSGNTGPAQ